MDISDLRLPLAAAVLLLAWAAGRDPLAAQEPVPEAVPAEVVRLDLAEALAGLESHNPELRLGVQATAAARARAITAGARPNPSLSLTREQLSDGGREYHETFVTLAQPLEVGGQRGIRREAADLEAEAAEARLEGERLRLVFEVRRTYVQAAAAELRIEAVEHAADALRLVERAGTLRFAEGDVSDFELRRLRVERARYETRLADERLELLRAGGALARLVAGDSLAAAGVLVFAADTLEVGGAAPALTLDAALAAARRHPEVRAARSDVEAAAARIALARRDRIPDVTVQGGYKRQSDGFRGPVLGLSLPLPLRNRNRGAIAEAEAGRGRAQAAYAAALRSAEDDVRRAWEARESLTGRLDLVGRQLLSPGSGLLEIARTAYEEGEMTLVELLDAADAYRASREGSLELTSAYLISTYDLERAAGLPPGATVGSARFPTAAADPTGGTLE